MTTRTHHMPFGTQVLEKDTGRGVCFRLWAPDCPHVGLCIPEGEADGAEGADGEQVLAMDPQGDGWFELTVPYAAAGTRYRFEINRRANGNARKARKAEGNTNGKIRVPDPASRFNPDDVHGASEVIDPAAFAWQDGAWFLRGAAVWRGAWISHHHWRCERCSTIQREI